MIIYSKTILSFIERLSHYAREMLGHRGIKCQRKTIVIENYIYPLDIVIFESSYQLGYFNRFEIGVNKQLIHYDTEIIKNILGHELAHFLTWVYFRDLSHGAPFIKICKRFKFLSSRPASINLDSIKKTEPIVLKVQKLLSLANSSNQYEAEAATAKANQLLLRYNLDIANLTDDTKLVSVRVLPNRRKTGKLSAIHKIVETFMVKTFFHYQNGIMFLEIFGAHHNVKIGEYVAKFLDIKLEEIWKDYSKKYQLSGIREKNSFMLGIGEGFTQKIKTKSVIDKALIPLKNQLEKDFLTYFPRLARSNLVSPDRNSFIFGQKAGSKLMITTPIEKSPVTKLIEY